MTIYYRIYQKVIELLINTKLMLIKPRQFFNNIDRKKMFISSLIIFLLYYIVSVLIADFAIYKFSEFIGTLIGSYLMPFFYLIKVIIIFAFFKFLKKKCPLIKYITMIFYLSLFELMQGLLAQFYSDALAISIIQVILFLYMIILEIIGIKIIFKTNIFLSVIAAILSGILSAFLCFSPVILIDYYYY